jgi:hypothetical protein
LVGGEWEGREEIKRRASTRINFASGGFQVSEVGLINFHINEILTVWLFVFLSSVFAKSKKINNELKY